MIGFNGILLLQIFQIYIDRVIVAHLDNVEHTLSEVAKVRFSIFRYTSRQQAGSSKMGVDLQDSIMLLLLDVVTTRNEQKD